MCRLLRLLLIRFPGRTFVFAGDSGYGTHEVARFCHRHRDRLTLVSKLHPDANLFAPPPPYARQRAARGSRASGCPSPARRPRPRRRTRLTVGWYGGGTRRVEAATGTGHWYKGGCGLVPVRWVFVKDATGTHRDEYLFTTDPALTADAVVGTYCGRWNIETTFQEARSALGLETTRGRCQNTVLRAAPCLFGLYTVVAVLFHALPAVEAGRGGGVAREGDGDVLRRPVRRPPVAVGRGRFATGRGRHGPRETPRARAGTAAHHARTGGLSD